MLYLIADFGATGPLRQLSMVARNLPVRFSCSFLALHGDAKVSVDGVPASQVGVHGYADPRLPVRLMKVLRSSRPDIVHSRLLSANYWAALAYKVGLVRHHVLNVTNSLDEAFVYNHGQVLGRLNSIVFGRVIGGCDVITVNSGYLGRQIQQRWSKSRPVTVIPNGIADVVPSRFDPPGRTVGVVSRIERNKRIPDVIAAFASIATQFPDATLQVAGDGADLPRCREIVSQEMPHLARRIAFLGHITDVSGFLESVSVFVSTSPSEGQPNAVMEAMAAGVPVVCAAFPGVEDLLTDGDDGLIFPPGDVAALAARLCVMLDDVDGRRRLGDAARQRIIAHHSPAGCAAQYATLYERLVHSELGSTA